MSQVSKHQLKPEMIALIYKEFSHYLSIISSEKGFSAFLDDFLTNSEKIMLSKRFMIMVLLMRHHTIEHIKNTLYVSNSAVMSVSSWLKHASSSTKQSLAKLDKEKNWEQFVDQIESILDKLPPGKYRNWQLAGREKVTRIKSRQLRSRLR